MSIRATAQLACAVGFLCSAKSDGAAVPNVSARPTPHAPSHAAPHSGYSSTGRPHSLERPAFHEEEGERSLREHRADVPAVGADIDVTVTKQAIDSQNEILRARLPDVAALFQTGIHSVVIATLKRQPPTDGSYSYSSHGRASKLKTLVVMPESPHEFSSMYGSEPTAGQLAQLGDFANRFRARGAQLVQTGNEGESALISAIRTAALTNATVLIVGHALRDPDTGGSKLQLANGTTVRPQKITEQVPQADVVFATCYSADLDPGSAITIEDALALVDYVARSWSSGESDGTTSSRAEMPSQSALLYRAMEVMSQYPRIRLSWTAIDRQQDRLFIEQQAEFSLIGGYISVCLIPLLGYVSVLFVMFTIPSVSDGAPSLRRRLVINLHKRRRAINNALIGLAVMFAVVLFVMCVVWLRRGGESSGFLIRTMCLSCIGVVESFLAYWIARTTPFAGHLGRVVHFIGGGLVGFWLVLPFMAFYTIAMGWTLVVAAMLIVIVAFSVGEVGLILGGAMAVYVGTFFLVSPKFMLVAARGAGVGRSMLNVFGAEVLKYRQTFADMRHYSHR